MRRQRARWSAVAGLVLATGLLGLPVAAVAQSATAEELVERVARVWAGTDEGALGGALDPAGVMISLQGGRERMEHGRALAALQELRAGRVGTDVRIVHWEEVGGTPAQGYAELEWESIVDGTSEPTRRTVYVGFIRRPEGWWVAEVRILP